MIPWRRRISQFVIVAIIAFIIFYAFSPKAVLVDVATVKHGYLQEVIEEEGKSRVIDRFMISTPVDGYARRIEIHVGDKVEKGQVLAELEPLRSRVLDPRSRAEAKAQVAMAKAALSVAEEKVKAAKADAVFAASELQRMTKLYKSKNISLGTYQQTQATARRNNANLQSAKFAVQVATFELKAAETTLQYSAASEGTNNQEKVSIVAPVSGQILKVFHESEGVVQAGQALLEIGDPTSLEVEVDVLSTDAVKITQGTKVHLTRWGGSKILQGQVRIVEPVGFTKISALGVEEQRVSIIIDIVSPVEDWLRLGDGYRVEAMFILWESDNVLQIPASALFRNNGQWAVFTTEEKSASLRQVEIGHRNGLFAEIIKGVSEGDIVITHPDDAVYDGKKIKRRYLESSE